MIQSFLEQGQWVTSISLAKMMYASGEFHRRDIAKVSNILSKLYKGTELLIRKERRRIYFHNVHKKHTATWAYRLNPHLMLEHEK